MGMNTGIQMNIVRVKLILESKVINIVWWEILENLFKEWNPFWDHFEGMNL